MLQMFVIEILKEILRNKAKAVQSSDCFKEIFVTVGPLKPGVTVFLDFINSRYFSFLSTRLMISLEPDVALVIRVMILF